MTDIYSQSLHDHYTKRIVVLEHEMAHGRHESFRRHSKLICDRTQRRLDAMMAAMLDDLADSILTKEVKPNVVT